MKGFGLDPQGTALDIYSRWTNIVEQYSARRLTKDSDKLPALSGIARRFRDATGAYYLAGLWGESLIYGLCWFSDRGHRRRPSEPRGPSWSWVAIEGPVRFPRPCSVRSLYETGQSSEAVLMGTLETVEARVLSAGCKTTTSDPTGAVGEGFIEMSGFVAVGTYMYREGTVKHTPYLCCRSGKHGVEAGAMEAFYADFRASDPEPEQIPQDGDALFLLKIGLVGWPPEPPAKFRALVLRRARSCPSCCERVGFVESSDHNEIDWFEDAQRCTIRII
ncbi:hypothetical protein B0J13DRAFT_576907 [Dactylonectria estremocensis]|uniref:Heterokaryon incompatibility domain-containing protein n=1 Tax=Dactylonectria estremocensis TaxID=1079267 RepID=A0A9P9D2Z8_9HYPO|nr:hypothetical protein B0J13DRAFT_576907 [Dactylonectria estremocensis]